MIIVVITFYVPRIIKTLDFTGIKIT